MSADKGGQAFARHAACYPGWNGLDASIPVGLDWGECADMKIPNIAWMGAGLLLAGVAGAAVVCRRKGERELPAEPGESAEHAALREILEQSAAYNDALFERVRALEAVAAPVKRPDAVAELTQQNQAGRRKIDALRMKLQEQLGAQGRTFADVEGFAELISQYRAVTLEQQRRHLEVFQRVRKMENMPDSLELHAFLKLGFKDEDQRRADTEHQLLAAANEQRELMLRAGRVMSAVLDAETAAGASAELNELGKRYLEHTARIRLYRDDDPAGAEPAVAELRSLYAALLPMLQAQARRLRAASFFGEQGLRDVVERMLPPAR